MTQKSENKKLDLDSPKISQPIDSKKADINEVQQHYNRDVWTVTSGAAKNKIESRTKQLERISTEILANPDGAFEEKETHKLLCDILAKIGCEVHSSYIYPTAFKAIYPNPNGIPLTGTLPTVGLICEYDAVKGVGHSNGHNLSTEATIGALIGVREAMKLDTRLVGNIVILGTPASEESGGKIKMMKEGAFDKIDVILALNPSKHNHLFPKFYCSQKISLIFEGIGRHIDCLDTIESRNAVDAAVLCYNNAMVLSNQMKPKCRIHCIIKNSGDIDYMVPKKSKIVFCIRAPEVEDLDLINKRLVDCGESAAQATRTSVEFHFQDNDTYISVNHNKELAEVFAEEANKLGMDYNHKHINNQQIIYRSTDLGNVSLKVPLINPSFSIGTTHEFHSKEFRSAVAQPEAQTNTIKAAIAMSFTIIKYLLTPTLQQKIKNRFQLELEDKKRIKNKGK